LYEAGCNEDAYLYSGTAILLTGDCPRLCLLDQDPLFVNAAAGDYHLKPESPALALGFQQLPLEQIGLQEDEVRGAIPVKAE